MMKLSNLDAGESLVFARELIEVKTELFNVQYPQLKARMLIPPSRQPASPAANHIAYRQYDRVGMAKMIAGYADDLPRVDLIGKEFLSPIKPLGVSFGYNLHEIQIAAKTGEPVDRNRAMVARDVIEEQIDFTLAFGDTATGVPGFLNNANVPTAAIVGGAWGPGKTADAIIADVADAIQDMVALTNGLEYPDTVVLPEAQFAYVELTPRSAQVDTTILEFMQAKFKRIKNWVPWYRLATAGAGAVGRMVLFKSTPDKVFSEIPREFEALEPQAVGLTFEVPCHARVGGTVIPFPLSMSYRDGV
jgi:hypothetical protein